MNKTIIKDKNDRITEIRLPFNKTVDIRCCFQYQQSDITNRPIVFTRVYDNWENECGGAVIICTETIQQGLADSIQHINDLDKRNIIRSVLCELF